MPRKYLPLFICVLVALTGPLYAADKGLVTETASVQIDALLVDFPVEEIERIARSHSQAQPSAADILELWRKGKGSLVAAIKLPTRPGINAQSEAVREIIYPTEFDNPTIPGTNAIESLVSRMPLPGAFEMREVGAILNCTPTVNPDGRTINLTLAVELASGPEMSHISVTAIDKNGQELELTVPQPVFHSRNVTTSIVVDDQSTHVLGGMENPEGDGITYLFLTATLIDTLGRPIWDQTGEIPKPAQPAR